MISIGITGGIGSGKTTVCRLFETLGIPVYYADDRAKQIMTDDFALVEQLKAAFGADIYDIEGHLRRSVLADRVFRDPEALTRLNQLVHPAVFRDAAQWMERRREYPYTLREAALLFESGSYKLVDEVVMIWAPEELRLQRAMARNGLSEADVRARMARQWSDEEKRALSQHVIVNDGERLLIPQVMALHQRWTEQAARLVQDGETGDSSTILH